MSGGAREKIDWRERVAETSKNQGKPGRGEVLMGLSVVTNHWPCLNHPRWGPARVIGPEIQYFTLLTSCRYSTCT